METMLKLVTNVVKNVCGSPSKMHFILSDLTKLQLSRQVLISAVRHKITRKCVIQEPTCSIRTGRRTDKQDGINSCYPQICQRF
jgi:hypothetical protein